MELDPLELLATSGMTEGNEIVPYERQTSGVTKLVRIYDDIERTDSRALTLYERLSRGVLRLAEDRIIKDQPKRNALRSNKTDLGIKVARKIYPQVVLPSRRP
jgi:hypothetical protein